MWTFFIYYDFLFFHILCYVKLLMLINTFKKEKHFFCIHYTKHAWEHLDLGDAIFFIY